MQTNQTSSYQVQKKVAEAEPISNDQLEEFWTFTSSTSLTVFRTGILHRKTAKMSMDLDAPVPMSDFHAQQQPEAT
jgi:hypothetical protein